MPAFVVARTLCALLCLSMSTLAASAAAPKKLPAPSAASGAQTAFTHAYSVAPAPAWVVPAKEDAAPPIARAGLHYRVVDDQTRLADKTVVAYTHIVRVVDDSAGLATAAHIEIEFDPSFQSLVLHHVDVVRQGSRVSQLRGSGRVQLLQRETQLERMVYDGRVTASIVADDVRVGDEVDIAYSVHGLNPVFEGRYAAQVWMTSEKGPVALYQYRLLAAADRDIHLRTGADDMHVSSVVTGDVRETLVRRSGVGQFHMDANSPYIAGLKDQVQVSEFADWQDVSRWGARVFSTQAAGPTDLLEEKVAEFKSAGDDAAQVVSALHFVQADVRYFGLEMGANSHRPNSAANVIKQRFGDCKDKVVLLGALLGRLGVQVQPVLVSMLYGPHVDSLLPSPLAFDHVIGRVELNGTPYLLDGTRNEQTGSLTARQATGLGFGLTLAADGAALAALPNGRDIDRVAVVDTFQVDDIAKGATLTSRMTYRGDLAEQLRQALADHGLPDVQTQAAAPYLRYFPKLQTAGPAEVVDAPDDDEITFVQHFTASDFWRFADQKALAADLILWSVADTLRPHGDTIRHDAYALPPVGTYRHSTSVEFTEDVYTAPGNKEDSDGDGHIALHLHADSTARRVTYAAELKVLSDQVTAADWPIYVDKARKMMQKLAFTTAVPTLSPARAAALKAEIIAIDEAMRKHALKLTTAVQVRSLAGVKVKTAQLAEGRLPPAARAELLTSRGVDSDQLGHWADAKADFAAAMELTPDTDGPLNGAAVNALSSGDYANAVTLASRQLARKPNDAEALRSRAIAEYFLHQDTAARADLQAMLVDVSQVREGYGLLWLALIAKRSGLSPEAALSPYARDNWPTEWPRAIVDAIAGTASADTAVKAASDAHDKASERLCEAHYYLGEMALNDGDKSGALRHFKQTIEQGVIEFTEDAAARHRVASLEQ